MKTLETNKNIKIVPCTQEYWEFVHLLRNNPLVEMAFIENKSITKTEQIAYMKKYWENYFIALYKGNFAGYYGVIDDDIRICVDPFFQKKGIGLFMVKEILKKYPKAKAKIKITNVGSQNLFKKAGYKNTLLIFENN